MARKILITGLPKIGKTTLIKRLASRFSDFSSCGFYTEEIIENGQRVGFKLISLESGLSEYLAHVNFESRFRVGRYGVNLSGFESFLKRIDFTKSSLIFIDEIGKMECFSNLFVKIVKDLMNSPKLVVATVGLKGSGLIEDVKKMPGISLYYLTKENREKAFLQIASEIESELKKD
jgi:nucleoside-triphosphatase